MTGSTSAPVPLDRRELAPLRAALLRLARADAARMLAAVDAEGAAVLRRADAEAEQARAAARAEADADAEQLLAREQGRREREARAAELRARGAAYDALVRRAREAVRGLAGEPGVRERLVQLARAALGPGASVREGPDGAVVAELAGRRVEYSLAALADDAVAALLSDREDGP